MHSNRQEAIDKAYAGDIVAVGLGETKTGDTLCTQDNPIALESMDFPEPVISISIKPESNADNEKLGEALHRLADEDPTFTVAFDQETNETIISGMGELHLEIIVDRLRREFGVVAEVGRPKWPTVKPQRCPRMALQTRQQSGGRGQYGHVVMSVNLSSQVKALNSSTKSPEAVFLKNIFPPVRRVLYKLSKQALMPVIL